MESSIIIRNEFITKPKKKDGQIEGEQSLNNKRLCIFSYDSEQGDFVGKWIDTPLFVRNATAFK